MARRARAARRTNSTDTATTPTTDPSDEALTYVLQELKVIDIKRRSILSGKRREPFMFAGLLLAGLVLGVTILSLALLWIFIAFPVFLAVSSQIFGPTGIRGRRQSAYKAIERSVEKIGSALPRLAPDARLRVFGLLSANKSSVQVTSKAKTLTPDTLGELAPGGGFFTTRYKYLVAIPADGAGRLDHNQPAIKGQYWREMLARKAVPDEIIAGAFEQHALAGSV